MCAYSTILSACVPKAPVSVCYRDKYRSAIQKVSIQAREMKHGVVAARLPKKKMKITSLESVLQD